MRRRAVLLYALACLAVAGAAGASRAPIRIGLASSARCRPSPPALCGAGPMSRRPCDWSKDFEAAALAQKLASRRTPIGEADRLIDDFARGKGPEKAERLTRVFAGVLELINTERDRVLHGIERYARGQRQLADRIRDEGDRISAVKDSPTQRRRKSRTTREPFAWDKRIFEERSQSLAFVCETPVLLEQRLFEIARRIQARLS